MTPDFIKNALDHIAANDPHVAEALPIYGYPEPRVREPGFETLMGIIIGQQVSVQAAAAIRDRLHQVVTPMAPEAFLNTTDDTLRAAGLSARKVEYGRSLATHMLDGHLDARALHDLDDKDVIAQITAVKGLGRWSADIYMLFSLGRADVWPAEDLAVQEALKRLKNLRKRPDRARSERLIAKWRPYRGVGALFLWHYYKGAP